MKRTCVWMALVVGLSLFYSLKSTQGSPPHPTVQSDAGLDTLVLAVQGMVCEGCEMAVESVLFKLSGVHSAKANHERGDVRIVVDREKGPSLAPS